MAREEAISRVRSISSASPEEASIFLNRLVRSEISLGCWKSKHPIQIQKLEDLRSDLSSLRTYLERVGLYCRNPWNSLLVWAETNLTEEGQELVASLILEPYGQIVDGLSECMADANTAAFRIDGSMPVSEVRDLITFSFGWALAKNWQDRQNNARAWYISEEKLEPRLGERFEEPISNYEQPLAPARDAVKAFEALTNWNGSAPVADFLMKHPEHRHTIRRAQISRIAPYGEIRGNTVGAELMPIDMLRAKLSFFGATHFDPRSDRWVRICMYAGAPYPEELTSENADDWVYPELSE